MTPLATEPVSDLQVVPPSSRTLQDMVLLHCFPCISQAMKCRHHPSPLRPSPDISPKQSPTLGCFQMCRASGLVLDLRREEFLRQRRFGVPRAE